MAFSTCQPWKQETHSTTSAAYSRHGQEHPAVAVGIKKQQTQGQRTFPDNGGETTDRPKSDGVTGRADLPCPSCEDERGVLHQRGKGVSLGRGECGGDWPSTKVTTSLPCLPESPKGGESGVAVAVMRSS
ncbi:MAG: hypothetical protein J6Y97_15035 [Prevotella sp.]|nr:hypothetical protein [Prevotella sp.]